MPFRPSKILPAWPSNLPQSTPPRRDREGRLTLPQLRVLRALNEAAGRYQRLNQAQIKEAAGFTPHGGTLSVALHGRKGSSSGPAEPGLLELGMVDFQGMREKDYGITQLGKAALETYMSRLGSLPPVRDSDTCTNRRYKSTSL